MICSFIPGRIRLRSPRFKDVETVTALTSLLKDQPGFIGLENNLSTGSILLRYDPEKVDQESALAAFDFLENEVDEVGTVAEETVCGCSDSELMERIRQSKDAVEYVSMIGAFMVCTSSAFLRSKGLHVYSGLALAGLTIQHIAKYRRRLAAIFTK